MAYEVADTAQCERTMPLKYPPCPPPRPIIGNLLDFRRDRLAFVTDCATHYGDLAHAPFASRHDDAGAAALGRASASATVSR